jgi:iduronate 2-sulfatase
MSVLVFIDHIRLLLVAIVTIAVVTGVSGNESEGENLTSKPNLLFIVCDDLRPELSVYGKPWAYTPNFERLANRSVTFDLAFAQVAVCNPSRDSMLTGLRPDTVGSHNFQASFRPHQPFFSHLKRAGYTTNGVGKVFNWDGEDTEIWSAYENHNNPTFNIPASTIKAVDQPENLFGDYLLTSAAISKLRALSSKRTEGTEQGKPFAVGLGLASAHPLMPIPRKYVDLIEKHVANNPWPAYNPAQMMFPKTAPIQSYHCCVTLNFDLYNSTKRNKQIQLNRVPSAIQEEAYHEMMWGYLAAISFIDAQVGRLLDAVDELKLWDSTTIIFTADHGIHLGEKGIWDKWTLFDESTHVPLMVHQPYSPFQGEHFTSPVELIDLFPTVLALTGTPYVKHNLPSTISPQGRSLEAIIMGRENTVSGNTNPSMSKPKGGPSILSLRKKSLQAKFNFAVSQVLLCSSREWNELFDNTGILKDDAGDELVIDRRSSEKFWSFCNMDDKPKAVLMGYSIRTREFRYTAYLPIDFATLSPDFSPGSVVLPWAEELYDHRPEALWSPSASLAALHSNNKGVEDVTGDDVNNPSVGSTVPVSDIAAHQYYAKWEGHNLVDDAHYGAIVAHYRSTLLGFLRTTARFAKLPIQRHSKEFHDYHKQYKGSSSLTSPSPIGSVFRFKSFDSVMRKDSSVTSMVTPKSPQREWQMQQAQMTSFVDSRKYTNELYGGAGNNGVNLLLIMYDDLRPELSIYGRQHMITPNFERLAKKSVVFDYCYTQVAVCNPSRNVMLTGLRPDTKRTYAFDAAPDPHLVLPTALRRIGYETTQAGKIFHWDGPNSEVWDHFWDWDWYAYQNKEWDFMKSTVMPDKEKPEDSYPDHHIASETIKSLRQFHERGDQKYMIAAGFKMPHTSLHVPYRYYDMYRNLSTTDVWKLTDAERSFPEAAPSHSFRCCTDTQFRFMNNEGADTSVVGEPLGELTHTITQAMYTENMWGYSAAVTYVDYQLGRILDVLDELDLWKNLTIVLTADHGMHSGEKGIWYVSL